MDKRDGWWLAALICGACGVALWLGHRSERPARATGGEPAASGELERDSRPLASPAPERELVPAGVARALEPAAAALAGERAAIGRKPPASDDLVARVVGPDGAPVAGIPLRLVPAANDAAHPVTRARAAEADALGRAVFEGVRPELRSSSAPWVLQVPIPFEPMPELSLTAALLDGPEVRAVLPSGGALEVVVLEDEESPALEGTGVELLRVPSGFEHDPVLPGGTPSWRSETHGGRALFPWVELGRTWELRCRPPRRNYVARVRADGPAALRARAEVEVRLAADQPVVVFRALDEHGTPLSRTDLVLERRSSLGFGQPEVIPARTDAAGRFSVVTAFDPFATRVFLVRTALTREALCGRAAIPGALKAGSQDGGDVVLAPSPVLVAGRVLNELGELVPDASVQAGIGLQASSGNVRRSGQQVVSAQSDERGAFELRGLLDESSFQVVASDGEASSERVDVHEGDREVELVLRRSWILSGKLLLDPGLDPRRIRFRLTPAGKEPFDGQCNMGTDGVFRFARLFAGVYDLECTLEGRVLRKLEGIALQRDTDLGLLDLSGLVQDYELELVGGADPIEGRVAWKEPGAAKAVTADFKGRRIRLRAPAREPIDVRIRARGFRAVFLPGLAGSRTVVLDPALSVRLALDTDGELPRYPYVLCCELMQEGETVSEPLGPRSFSAENRELAFTVASPGQVHLRWILERRFDTGNSSGSRSTSVLGAQEAELEILDVPAEQRFVLHLDGQALSALTRHPPW